MIDCVLKKYRLLTWISTSVRIFYFFCLQLSPRVLAQQEIGYSSFDWCGWLSSKKKENQQQTLSAHREKYLLLSIEKHSSFHFFSLLSTWPQDMAQQSLIQSRAEAADSRQTALFPLLHTHTILRLMRCWWDVSVTFSPSLWQPPNYWPPGFFLCHSRSQLDVTGTPETQYLSSVAKKWHFNPFSTHFKRPVMDEP